MVRFPLLAILLLAAMPARAADLPKDISTEARAEFVKRWQPAYLKATEGWSAKLEDAATLAKFPATEKEGKKRAAEARTALKNISARPWAVPDSPFRIIQAAGVAVGDVVMVQGTSPFLVAEERRDGTLVETVSGPPDKATITRYLIAPAIDAPKPVGKKPTVVDLSGLWYWAGTVEVKGKPVPVLYRFELKKDDFPPAKK